MKKISLVVMVAGLILIGSCKKNNSSAGSWTFEGVNYGAASASVSTLANNNVVLTANTSSPTNSGTLAITFLYQPVTSGTYKVVNYTTLLDSNQLFVEFTNGTSNFSYYSTGNDNINAKVTVSSQGKVSVSIPATWLEDYANPVPDSGQVVATINQQ